MSQLIPQFIDSFEKLPHPIPMFVQRYRSRNFNLLNKPRLGGLNEFRVKYKLSDNPGKTLL